MPTSLSSFSILWIFISSTVHKGIAAYSSSLTHCSFTEELCDELQVLQLSLIPAIIIKIYISTYVFLFICIPYLTKQSQNYLAFQHQKLSTLVYINNSYQDHNLELITKNPISEIIKIACSDSEFLTLPLSISLLMLYLFFISNQIKLSIDTCSLVIT